MNTRFFLTTLPLILVSGCWPFLGGSFDDYVDGEGTEDPDSDLDLDTRNPDAEGTDDPDTADPDTADPDTDDPDTDDPDTQGPGGGPVIAGWVEQTVLLGPAWAEPDVLSVRAILGGVEDGETFRYTQGLPASGDCVTSWNRGMNLIDVLTPVGFSSIEITLPPVATFEGQPASDQPDAVVGGLDGTGPAAENASVTISGSVDAGSLGGVLTRTPSAFSVDSPSMDGAAVPTLSFGQFDVEYSGTLSDAVAVSVIYVNSEGEAVSGHDCLGRSGSVSVDPSILGLSVEDIAYAQVVVTRIRETSGSLSGTANAESEVVGVYSQVGLVLFE
ncbi:MAG: hypothetical protein ACJAZO_001816 [Myxococcota bacterium]|jgi:hypothetical protein